MQALWRQRICFTSRNSMIHIQYCCYYFCQQWLLWISFVLPPDPPSILLYLLYILTSMDWAGLAPSWAQTVRGTTFRGGKREISVFIAQDPFLVDSRLAKTIFLQQSSWFCWSVYSCSYHSPSRFWKYSNFLLLQA